MRLKKLTAAVTAIAMVVPVTAIAAANPATADEDQTGILSSLFIEEYSITSSILKNGSTQTKLPISWYMTGNSEAPEESKPSRFTLDGLGATQQWNSGDCTDVDSSCHKTITINSPLPWGQRTVILTAWKGEDAVGRTSSHLTVSKPSAEIASIGTGGIGKQYRQPRVEVGLWPVDSDGFGNATTGVVIGIRKSGTNAWKDTSFKVSRNEEYSIAPLSPGTKFDLRVAAKDGNGTGNFQIRKNRTPPTAPKAKPTVKFQGTRIVTCRQHKGLKPQRQTGGIVNTTKSGRVFMQAPRSKKWVYIDMGWLKGEVVKRIKKPGTYKFRSAKFGNYGASKLGPQRSLKVTKRMIKARPFTVNDCSFWAL